MKESIAQLDNSEYEAVLFGNTTDVFFNIQTYNMGIISDDLHLALLYNAADCFVAPSIQENLANTVLEALSCGTPVVAFDIGGMSDMIIHEKNGYLAKPFVLSDLLKGIRYCTDNNDKLNTDTIRHIIESFSEYKIGNDYNKLYNSILR